MTILVLQGPLFNLALHKYGAENQSDNSCIARAAFQFGTSHDLMENERETLLRILGDQVNSSLPRK